MSIPLIFQLSSSSSSSSTPFGPASPSLRARTSTLAPQETNNKPAKSAVTNTNLRDLKIRLSEPIPDLKTLRSLLSSVNRILSSPSSTSTSTSTSHSPSPSSSSTSSSASGPSSVEKQLPAVQLILLEKVLPHWVDLFVENGDRDRAQGLRGEDPIGGDALMEEVEALFKGCFLPPVSKEGPSRKGKEKVSVEPVIGGLEIGQPGTDSRILVTAPDLASVHTLVAYSSYISLTRQLSTLNTDSGISSDASTGSGSGNQKQASSGSRHRKRVITFTLDLLADLVRSFGLEEMYVACFGSLTSEVKTGDTKSDLKWDEILKAMLSIPARVDNLVGSLVVDGLNRIVNGMSPRALERQVFFDRSSEDVEDLVWALDSEKGSKKRDLVARFQVLVVRMHHLGLFRVGPRSRKDVLGNDFREVSFFSATMPGFLRHLRSSSVRASESGQRKGNVWQEIIYELPRETASAIIWSFLQHLTSRMGPTIPPPTNKNLDDLPLPTSSPMVQAATTLLDSFIGTSQHLFDHETDLFHVVIDELIIGHGKGREYGPSSLAQFGEDGVEFRNRVIVSWVARSRSEKPLSKFLDSILSVWSDSKHVKYASFGRHIYITHLMVLIIGALGPSHPLLYRLAFETSFLASVQAYLTHSDASIRRLGMLVAELVSAFTIPADHDGGGRYAAKPEGKPKARNEKTSDDLTKELEGMLEGLGGEEDEEPNKPKPAPSSLKRLDFGAKMWDGKGQGKEECRYLRAYADVHDGKAPQLSDESDWLLGWKLGESEPTASPTKQQRPTRSSQPKKVNISAKQNTKPAAKIQVLNPDSEDELVGYASDQSFRSSRSPSPTPSYLEEIAADPMLNMGARDKVERPIYIIQLIELLKSRNEPDKLEIALKWGESLIRRKREFGTELQENALELTTMLLALSDSYDLVDFEARRQGMLIAVGSAVPKIVAPFLIQQYFEGQYSLIQRSAILTALAMSAREMAGLATVNKPDAARIDFPSKVLPAHIHSRYVTDRDVKHLGNGAAKLLEDATSNVTNDVLTRAKNQSVDQVPEIAREQRLKVNRRRPRPQGKKIQEIDQSTREPPSLSSDSESEDDTFGFNTVSKTRLPPAAYSFREVAAEYYVLPLINRFWDYFEDEMTRESRAGNDSSYMSGGLRAGNRSQKRLGTSGTGTILSALAMSAFLNTLTVLLHASRLASSYLHVIAPESLELAITLGSRLTVPSTDSETNILGLGAPIRDQTVEQESGVVSAALELCLVCLDGCKEIDGGRSLALDKPELLMAAGEWAGKVFEEQEKGNKMTIHAGGAREGKEGRAAAGVVVIVSEIVEKMRPSMGV